ncbi:hypothetical protein [Methylococcus sp. EFPC2]|uniref:hypothetical protein n=1 Tax=Methylococcus sp. EFPC2 TaxID=2812648 RepID=UPI0019675BF2|nr:hypothetical protein [Methylococcus sp. EFPC2]QSA95654.1 hypothetical protein JWZ97_10355 [Methylococcus sp. EFPC2]
MLRMHKNIFSTSLQAGLCLLWLAAPGQADAAYPEPSESEMKSAIERTMVQRGGTQGAPGEVVVENALSGVSLKIVDFEKLGCSPAQGAGYFCTYQITTKANFYSNEGTRAGNNHAAGANALLGWVAADQ